MCILSGIQSCMYVYTSHKYTVKRKYRLFGYTSLDYTGIRIIFEM